MFRPCFHVKRFRPACYGQLPGRDVKQKCAAQALMQPSRQSVEEVKRVVAEARHKVQRPPTNINGTFNEEDFMDGDLVDEDMA